MAYREPLHFEETDNGQITLRNGFVYCGHLRRWNASECLYPGGSWTWVFIPNVGEGKNKKTFTDQGCFRLSGATSKFDVIDFRIGTAPRKKI